MSLGVCGGCGRFAHFGAGCPFCGGAISAPNARKGGRRARNGMLVAAIAAAACGGTTSDGKDASTSDAKNDYMAAPPYGAPAYGAVPVDSALRTALPDVLAAGDVCLAHNETAGRALRGFSTFGRICRTSC